MPSLLLLTALLLASPLAHAIPFEVIGRSGEVIYRDQAIAVPGETVGRHTISVLERARATTGLRFEGDESGILSVNELGSALEVGANGSVRAYGWCYALNGVVPELMPDEARLQSDEDRIRWFYAFALYESGQWTSQCVPAEQHLP